MSEAEYLEAILRPLLSQPEELKVTRTVDERGVLLSVDVAPEDMGRVIGKSGQTAHSVRRLLRQYGANGNSIVSMRINEPEGGRGGR